MSITENAYITPSYPSLGVLQRSYAPQIRCNAIKPDTVQAININHYFANACKA